MADDPQIPQLPDVIKAALAARLLSVYTGIPAVVVDYDEDSQTITAQIATLGAPHIEEDGTLTRVNIGPINRVPVCFPGTGAWSITWPIKQGDTVQLQFCNGSIDRWLSQGGQGVDPMDDRRFAKDDAVALTGLRAIPDALTSTAFDSAAMVIAGAMIKLGSSAASEPPALNSELAAFFKVLLPPSHGGSWTVTPSDGGLALQTAIIAFLSSTPGFPLGAAKVQLEKAT